MQSAIINVLIGIVICYILTLFSEGIIIWIYLRDIKYLKYNFLCNTATNPLLNGVLIMIGTVFSETLYSVVLIMGEIAVLFWETTLYGYMTEFSYRKRFFLSLITNAVSFGLGIILFNL